MITIRKASVSEIECHLIKLGKGNHSDNMKQVTAAPRHILVELSEQEFRSLIFLESKDVATIMPCGHDRRLEIVSARAISLPKAQRLLSENWNIDRIQENTELWLAERDSALLPTLLLRDVSGEEKNWSPEGWYLQDGAHRSLGYLVAIMRGQTHYEPQQAYCATSRP